MGEVALASWQAGKLASWQAGKLASWLVWMLGQVMGTLTKSGAVRRTSYPFPSPSPSQPTHLAGLDAWSGHGHADQEWS